MEYLLRYRDALATALEGVDLQRVKQLIQWLMEARDEGRRIFVFGNGGSAATASHFATDLGKGASYNRPERFRVHALTDSMSTITAYANDVGYEAVFLEQLRGLAEPHDLVIALSGSGRSLNVVSALEYANEAACRTVALTGRDGGLLGPVAQLELNVPVQHMGRIEDCHMAICHMVSFYFMDGADTTSPNT